MKAITVRLTDKDYDTLKLRSVVEHKPMVEIIRRAMADFMQTDSGSMERMRQMVVEERARGPRDEAVALEMAKSVAAHDDEEGLGPIKAARARKRPAPGGASSR